MTLPNGRRIIEQPVRSDILQMLQRYQGILRGAAVAFIDTPDVFHVYVWPARSISHWYVLNELLKSAPPERYFSFKIGDSPERLKQDNAWRKETVYDCGGYYAVFGAFTSRTGVNDWQQWIDSSNRLKPIFHLTHPMTAA